ncbi:MAG: cobalamin biosynthesis protein CobQ [Amylibacter sp.]
MNTPAHLLLAAGVFAKPDCPKITTAAIIGGLLPDLSLYVMTAFSLFYLGNTPEHVFDVQYFSVTWQKVFAIDNSFILWGLLAGIAFRLHKPWLIVLAGSAILHLCFDFPLHHDDARMHFWPVSNWIFESPVSYWDNRHYGSIISKMELMMVIGILILLWHRFKSPKMRVFYALLAGLEIAPIIIFGLMH